MESLGKFWITVAASIKIRAVHDPYKIVEKIEFFLENSLDDNL